MPQNWGQWLLGYARLTADTLTQRIQDALFVRPDDPVFQKRSENDDGLLHGKTAIVTGANTGVGYETAVQLCQAGAHVILACRTESKALDAMDRIAKSLHPLRCSMSFEHLDLSSLDSVRSFANTMQTKYASMLNIVVCNGGVMAVPHTQPESHMMVNHVSHALLTLLLLPMLHARNGRVVFVSSLTAEISDLHYDDIHFVKRPYAWMTAYANSKLCMIHFMRALHTRLQVQRQHGADGGVIVNAVHPGESASDVSRYMGKTKAMIHKKVIGPLFLLPVSHSARTSTFVGTSEDSNVTEGGKLFHRIRDELVLSQHLLHPADVQRTWEFTIELSGINEHDKTNLKPYLDLQK